MIDLKFMELDIVLYSPIFDIYIATSLTLIMKVSCCTISYSLNIMQVPKHMILF